MMNSEQKTLVNDATNSSMLFETFVDQMAFKLMPLTELSHYVERDPSSFLPRLQFKSTVFSQERSNSVAASAIAKYDINEFVYQLLRDKEKLEWAETQDGPNNEESIRAGASPKLRIVAEGDSWFRLPKFLGIYPSAIADTLKTRGKFQISNVSKWGHRIDEMQMAGEYLTEIERIRAHGIILSAGGNDIQDALVSQKLIKSYHKNRRADNYLTSQGLAELNRIATTYRQMLAEISQTFPRVKIWLHGYDYPQPGLYGGQYLGQYMHELGIPENKMSLIVSCIIDQLNYRVETIACEVSNARYINCRNKTTNTRWFDDMHPSNKGFKILAQAFEQQMLS